MSSINKIYHSYLPRTSRFEVTDLIKNNTYPPGSHGYFVYAIPNNDPITIQRHLNLHDELNDGTPQQIALVIFSDGSWEPVKNSK